MTKANESKPLVVGLAGFGTVGGGLARLLKENADIIRRRTGRDIVVKRVLVRNAQKARNVPLPEGAELTTDPALLTDDPDIDVLVELIGGIDQARALIDRALDQGKPYRHGQQGPAGRGGPGPLPEGRAQKAHSAL